MNQVAFYFVVLALTCAGFADVRNATQPACQCAKCECQDGKACKCKECECKNCPKRKVAADPLVGVWRFSTTDGHNELNGTVSVWKRGVSYVVVWSGASESAESTGITTTIGHGMREGDVFAIAWRSGDHAGLTMLKIEKGRLSGQWTPPGSGQGKEEVWVFLAKHSKGA